MFYVYEWFVKDTNEIIYVGKGTGNRYKVRKHNDFFNDFIKRQECDSRIIKEFENEKDAFEYEYNRINELKDKGQCVCNNRPGGFGGMTEWWTDERRKSYSVNNAMKSDEQRNRMKKNNPMKDKDVAEKSASKHRRVIVFNGKRYKSLQDAAIQIGVSEATIMAWCKKGHNTKNEPCYYEDGLPTKFQNKKPYKHKLSPIAKAVEVDGVVYNSIADAARSLNASFNSFKWSLNKNNKYKGHICKYVNQQPSQGKSDNSTLKGSTTNG